MIYLVCSSSVWNSSLTYNVHLDGGYCKHFSNGALFFYQQPVEFFNGENYTISSRQLVTVSLDPSDPKLPSSCPETTPTTETSTDELLLHETTPESATTTTTTGKSSPETTPAIETTTSVSLPGTTPTATVTTFNCNPVHNYMLPCMCHLIYTYTHT